MRHRYQHHVDALLAELAERRERINVLKTWGVQPAGLHELKEELRAVRVELAATTAATSTISPNGRPRSHAAHSPTRRHIRELMSTKDEEARTATAA